MSANCALFKKHNLDEYSGDLSTDPSLLTRDVPVLPGVGPEEVDVAPPVPLAGDGVVVAVVRPDGVQHRHEVPRAAAVAEALLVLEGNSVALSMAILATMS